MFIELAQYLRCPGAHDETYCVVTPDRMEARHIIEGTVGCPACRREFPIVDGVAMMIEGDPEAAGAAGPDPAAAVDPTAVAALLHLSGEGGYVVLAGSAATLAPELEPIIDGVHFVAVNPPPQTPRRERLSRLRGDDAMPLRSNMARGVVLGAECGEVWGREAARVLLRGLRVVQLDERELPEGLETLAAGSGMVVGEKR